VHVLDALLLLAKGKAAAPRDFSAVRFVLLILRPCCACQSTGFTRCSPTATSECCSTKSAFVLALFLYDLRGVHE